MQISYLSIKKGYPSRHRIIDLAAACVSWSEASESIPCPLAHPEQLGRAGLLWIGEKFYPTPQDFLDEANHQGISRRIPAVPKGFEPGKTWVLLAHRKGVNHVSIFGDPEDEDREKMYPAIFSVFRPTAVEYVVKEDETQDDLERLAKRGLTPVMVKNKVAQ